MPGFSNHIYGTTELGLSVAVLVGGQWRLVVPDTNRQRLRIIGWQQGVLVEVGTCNTPAPVVGPLRVVPASRLNVGLTTGGYPLDLQDCSARAASH